MANTSFSSSNNHSNDRWTCHQFKKEYSNNYTHNIYLKSCLVHNNINMKENDNIILESNHELIKGFRQKFINMLGEIKRDIKSDVKSTVKVCTNKHKNL